MKTKLTTKTLAILVCVVMVIVAFAAVAAARAEKCDCGGTIRLVGDSDVLESTYRTTCTHGPNGTSLGDSLDWVYVYKTIRTWKCTGCDYEHSAVIGTKEVWACQNGGN